jgi:hypothetical protein
VAVWPAIAAAPQASAATVTAGSSQSQSWAECARKAAYGARAMGVQRLRRAASGAANATTISASPSGPSSARVSR